MAIDTVQKRYSALTYGSSGTAYPTGVFNEAERRDAMGGYSGNVLTKFATIAAQLPQVSADIAATLTHRATVAAMLPLVSADVAARVVHKATMDSTLPQLVASIRGAGVSEGGDEGAARIGETPRLAIERGKL